MNTKYIIGGVLALVFLGVGLFSLDKSKIEYRNIAYAKESAKRVQVKGVWIKEKGADYNSQSNTFAFEMTDTDGGNTKVVYHGPRPNNFEIAESIVVKGKYENGTFQADEILTKCPSKYEGNADQLKETTHKQ